MTTLRLPAVQGDRTVGDSVEVPSDEGSPFELGTDIAGFNPQPEPPPFELITDVGGFNPQPEPPPYDFIL